MHTCGKTRPNVSGRAINSAARGGIHAARNEGHEVLVPFDGHRVQIVAVRFQEILAGRFGYILCNTNPLIHADTPSSRRFDFRKMKSRRLTSGNETMKLYL